MKHTEFQSIINDTLLRIKDLTATKGEEYKGAEDNQFGNFERGALELGLTREQILMVYLSKHLDSIRTYIRDKAKGERRQLSEPIIGRIDDAILYLILLRAMVIDDERTCKAIAEFDALVDSGVAIELAIPPTSEYDSLLVDVNRRSPFTDSDFKTGDDVPVPELEAYVDPNRIAYGKDPFGIEAADIGWFGPELVSLIRTCRVKCLTRGGKITECGLYLGIPPRWANHANRRYVFASRNGQLARRVCNLMGYRQGTDVITHCENLYGLENFTICLFDEDTNQSIRPDFEAWAKRGVRGFELKVFSTGRLNKALDLIGI